MKKIRMFANIMIFSTVAFTCAYGCIFSLKTAFNAFNGVYAL